MALLLFLLRCREELNILVEAAHVNHGIRGAQADADAECVSRFCATHAVPFHLLDAVRQGMPIPAHPGEEWARKLRYNYFDRLAEERGAKIATAHTLSDQTETLLFRLARGTGLHGAAGIPVRRGPYVRPFLCLTRDETVGYCDACGQSYVQDATNEQDEYARNRIRHFAVPALKAANPAAEHAVGRFCEQAARLDEWLTEKARSLLRQADRGKDRYDLSVLAAAEEPILERALQLLISPVRDTEERYVDLLHWLVMGGRGAVQLTKEVRFTASRNILTLECRSRQEAQPQPCPLEAPGAYSLPGGFGLRAELEKYEDFLKNPQNSKKDSNCYADYAKIQKNVLLRTRRPGDCFAPPGRGCRKTLKKLLNEAAVPPAQRSLLPLLADGSQVLWIAGFGFAEGLAPGPGTKTVLKLNVFDSKEDETDV